MPTALGDAQRQPAVECVDFDLGLAMRLPIETAATTSDCQKVDIGPHRDLAQEQWELQSAQERRL